MSAQVFEQVLAELYVNPEFRENFVVDARNSLKKFNLTVQEIAALENIDRAGLIMASKSFFHKRQKRIQKNCLKGKVIFRLQKLINSLIYKFRSVFYKSI